MKAMTKTSTPDELRAIPAMDLMGLWFATDAGNHLADVPHWTIDGDWLHPDFENTINSPDSAKLGVMLGDCTHEELLFPLVLSQKPKLEHPISVNTALEEVEASIRPHKVTEILEAYGIKRTSTGEEVARELLRIIGDIGFRRACHERAKQFTEKGHKVYRYLFEEITPFGGPCGGHAAHALDLSYVFTNPTLFNDVEHPEWERNIQHAMQEKWVVFANGEEPWRPQSEGRYYAFGPEGHVGEIDQAGLEERRSVQTWSIFDGLSKEELKRFGVTCNKAYAELSGHSL